MSTELEIWNDFETDSMGKIEDAGRIVDGGRIDAHWSGEDAPRLFPKHFIGVSEILNHPWLHDSNEALKHFNLRSIEFGNWMNQEDRANFLYATMLSLHHLAKIFKIKDRQIGLGGKLSIALGARGKGGAAGHYEATPYSVINITKTQGIGVLAHEYAHAVDNVISFYTGGKSQKFVSGGRTTRKGYDEAIAESGNWFEQQFEEFFNILYFDKKGAETKFNQSISKKEEYWNRRNEVFARASEVWVKIKLNGAGIKNHFLVLGAGGPAYPDVPLLMKVGPLMTKLYKKAFELFKNEGLEGVHLPVQGYKGLRKVLKENADLEDTLENIKRIAVRDAYQVKALASQLEADSVEQTSENIWNYLRTNTRYKLDENGLEELRTPSRSLVDGEKGLDDERFGIDCDDYTILISALLINLKIPHEYRVAAYKTKGKFQHIYPVAFDEFGNEFIIDVVPEIPSFNNEAQPIIDLKTIKMDLHELSGVGEVEMNLEEELKQDLIEEMNEPFSLSGIDDDEEDDILEAHFLNGLGEVDSAEEADIILSGSEATELLERGILAEVNKARILLQNELKTPTVLSQTINVKEELEIINDVLDAWDDESERMSAISDAIATSKGYSNFFKSLALSLDKLDEEDDELNGLDDDPIYLAKIDMSDSLMAEILDDEDLEGLGRRRKRGRFKRFFKKVGKGLKKAVKTVVRYNPATMAVRGAILLVLRMNVMKIAARLIYGYLTPNQAQAKGLDMNEYRKLVNAKNKAEKFYTRIGGKSAKFKNAIVRGRAAKKTGLRLSGDLGVAVTAGTTTAASGFIAFAKRLLSKINPAKLFRNVSQAVRNKRSASASSPTPQVSLPTAFQDDAPALREMRTPDQADEKQGFMQKVKSFFTKHKKKIIIVGVGGITALVILIAWKKIAKKKKRSLAGIKAARTRARNRRKYAAPKRRVSRKTTTRKSTGRTLKGRSKTVGRGSTTIIRVPSKSIKKTRVSRRSNANRLRAMHKKAKMLQKKSPRAKYSTLLKKASKMI